MLRISSEIEQAKAHFRQADFFRNRLPCISTESCGVSSRSLNSSNFLKMAASLSMSRGPTISTIAGCEIVKCDEDSVKNYRPLRLFAGSNMCGGQPELPWEGYVSHRQARSWKLRGWLGTLSAHFFALTICSYKSLASRCSFSLRAS